MKRFNSELAKNESSVLTYISVCGKAFIFVVTSQSRE